MLQGLRLDRFKLVVHMDTKPMPGIVLTTGKGKPKLKEADDSGNSGCQAQPPPRPNPDVVPYIVASCRNLTMEGFAAIMRGLSNEYVTKPVADSTGLKGAWDFDLKWTPKGPLAAGQGGISLFDAVDKELRLTLQPEKLPMPVIVVDSVNQKPTDNPPGVSRLLSPPPPAEFEVASIKPSTSDTPPPPPGARQVQPGGRLNWFGVPLRALITQAWDLDPDPHAEIAGAPKWLDSARFDLVAKPPDDATADGRQIFSDDFEECFALCSWTASGWRPTTKIGRWMSIPWWRPNRNSRRPIPRIALAVRSGLPSRPRTPPKARRLWWLICQNVTMAQFADRLQDIARSYIRYPVQDATGIEGSWDLTLTFHPAPPPGGRGGRGGPADAPMGALPPDRGPAGGPATDSAGAITLFIAVEKELGLKLQVHKRPMPVLVIDHIEQKPTDN